VSVTCPAAAAAEAFTCPAVPPAPPCPPAPACLPCDGASASAPEAESRHDCWPETRVALSFVCVFGGLAVLVGFVLGTCLVNYGAPEWHWRIVLAGLVSSDSRALILTPDGDMYIEDFNEAVAVRWLGPNSEVPEGNPRQLIYHFGEFPSAATLRRLMQEGAYTAGLEDQRRGFGVAVWGAGGAADAAAGGAAAGPGGGAGRVAAGAPAFVPAQPSALGAPSGGEDDGPGPGALQGRMGVGRDFRPPARPTAQPVSVHTVRWVAAESVEYPGGSVIRGDDVAFNDSELVAGRRGVIVLMGESALIEDIGDGDVEAYRSKEAHHDARLLKLQRDSRGARHRPWRDVARDVSAVKQDDWPVPGPQTAEWCTQFLDQWGVSEHETLAKILERLGTHDQCDVVNLASAEDILRRTQLIEYFYCEVGRQAETGKQQDKKGGKGARVEEMAIFSGKHREYGEVGRSLGMIQTAVAELGRPPAGLTRQGALAELLAKRSFTGEKAAARVAESALKRPCYDPSLQGRPRRHARLLAALDGAGILEWRRRGSPRVGLFTAWKKNGKQRLIVDARLSNLCFAQPDPVDLATGGSSASLEVDPGPPVCLAQVDIQPGVTLANKLSDKKPGMQLGLLERGFAAGRGLEAILGGCVAERDLLPVAEAGRWSDRWRFSRGAEDRVRPRGASLREELNMAAAAGLDDLDRVGAARHLGALGEVDRGGAVPEIGPQILQGSWTTVSAGRWKRREAMPILEGRALVWGVRHVGRGLSEFGKRVLFLTDGLSEAFGLRQDWQSQMSTGLPRPRSGVPNLEAPRDSPPPSGSLVRPGGAAKRRASPAALPTLARAAPPPPAPRVRPGGRARAAAATRRVKPRPEVQATWAERAAAPQGGFPEDKRTTDGEGLTLLERESVGDHNQRVYQSALAEFRSFFVTLGLRLRTAADYDEAALEWAHQTFFDGGDAQEGTKLKAVLQYYPPRLLATVTCAAANKLAASQDLHAARLIIVMFVFYPRPVELMSLTGRQVVPPVRAAGHNAWSIVLFPMEEETPSKTGACNESLLGNLPFYNFIGDVLKLLEAGVGDKELAAQVRYAQLAQAFRAAGQQLGLEGPPGLHQLRHGGASADLAIGRRSIPEGSRPLGERQLGDEVRQGRPRRRPAGQAAGAFPRARHRLRQEDWRHPLRTLPTFAARAGGAVALEVFSGSGNLSQAWRRRQRALGHAIFDWDLRWGDEYDLTRQRAQRLVRGWVNNGLIAAAWLGAPCHSWSRARDIRPGPPPLRSDVHAMGLPDLAPRDAEK
ncbi:unnamed protein product, partial [Prorocentrum cordatum]